jgi:hypothetical protein
VTAVALESSACSSCSGTGQKIVNNVSVGADGTVITSVGTESCGSCGGSGVRRG